MYEFEKKRVLIASENEIKVLAYQPIDQTKGIRLVKQHQTNKSMLQDPYEQQQLLFCCAPQNDPTDRQESENDQ